MTQVAFSAPHREASNIGLKVLEDGGNAVDAMIAAAAAISVLYPHMNSLAGDGFWLIHEPGHAPRAIDACGTAAERASIDYYRNQGLEAIPARGAQSALTMAGTLAGWQRARELIGETRHLKPLNELLAPAASLAREGVLVTDSLAAASRKVAAELQGEAEYQWLFTRNGQPLASGDTLRNPELGDFLDRLARQGLKSFYRGDIADDLAAALEAAGSPLRLTDFENYHAKLVTPLSLTTRFGECYNLPAPTQGLASLIILALYDRLYRDDWSEAKKIHTLVEATKQAFLIRDREITDPRYMRQLGQLWLADQTLDELAGRIGDTASPWPRVAEPGDTVWMGCVDRRGTMVSFIQSLYWEFGSGLVLPGTGLVWNNRGLSFRLDPNHHNALRPGARPLHTLNPALALFNDGRRMAYGTMGGEGQPQTQAALLTRYWYDGMPLDEAISRGRWLLGRTWGETDEDLKLEADLADAVGDDLARMGHRTRTVPSHSEMMGHAGAVVALNGGPVTAASDPRSDGAGLVGRSPA
ncbi:gamma-glutamyltransferase family protein [Marinimicrobium agarilyticum]|uniref:gamma-glutamyltransferase family protein n=1 Tax=Marinimicrobium agarilyticum TaxID=306546 RepID=UPI0003FE71D9|nr:gamma-glutamyltransferase [Marinimicrobium agarilyticum]